jgi:hypothetical protein
MTNGGPVKRTKKPGTSEAARWASHPFTGDLAAVSARVEAVADREAANAYIDSLSGDAYLIAVDCRP